MLSIIVVFPQLGIRLGSLGHPRQKQGHLEGPRDHHAVQHGALFRPSKVGFEPGTWQFVCGVQDAFRYLEARGVYVILPGPIFLEIKGH